MYQVMHVLYVQWFTLCSWLYTGTSILTTIIFVDSKLDIKVSFLFGALALSCLSRSVTFGNKQCLPISGIEFCKFGTDIHVWYT